MSESNALESLLKRDRIVVIAGLVGVIVAAWICILLGAGTGMTAFEMTVMSQRTGLTPSLGPADDNAGQPVSMAATRDGTANGMAGMAMDVMTPVAWTPGYALVMFFMWWIMMVAMMLPSAAPVVLLFAAVRRRQSGRRSPYAPVGSFAAGYLVAWGGFSLFAIALQWGLERAALLSPMMASTSVVLGGVLLLAAGIYQLTPLKHACLRHCRSPLQFLSQRWRQGPFGALRMGFEHGSFCLGCCWVLMGLLFFGGVMNLYWIIGLAVFVLLEKSIPAGIRLGWVGGIGLIAWGSVLIVSAV